jgi:hypothetical protein
MQEDMEVGEDPLAVTCPVVKTENEVSFMSLLLLVGISVFRNEIPGSLLDCLSYFTGGRRKCDSTKAMSHKRLLSYIQAGHKMHLSSKLILSRQNWHCVIPRSPNVK